DKMAIAAFIRDPFAHAWEMFTPTNFVRWLYEKPSFVDRVIQLLTNFNIEMIKRIGEVGVDLIISGGDYAEKKGPMTPIDFFRRTVFPNLKKQVEAA
ncbi:MAG: hypothetical protein GTO54_10075, partial [Nitrososphaeria archaeon]|nr:hypothetical protein [Nitrososphaeria archaeon]